MSLSSSRLLAFSLFAISLSIAVAGCSRTHYRIHADKDAYCILHEKAGHTSWRPPSDYSVYPSPASRLFDPTPADCPRLPTPAPQLYAYGLPETPERDPARFTPDVATQPQGGPNTHELPSPADTAANESISRIPPIAVESKSTKLAQGADDRSTVQAASYFSETELKSPPPELFSSRRSVETKVTQSDSPLPDGATSNSGMEKLETDEEFKADAEETVDLALGVQQVPIPASYWGSLPPDCLQRMLEFDSVREEYLDTFGRKPSADQLDDAQRLALEDIIDLTMLNSRELQAQKEALYRVALSLSLERFDYELKPSVGGNGTAANYTHNRNSGLTVNNLRIPTNLQVDKMLCTGGDILARFANSILLTFNGPQGFAADVGSDLLFDFSQSVLQRDVRLEGLTQSERNLVYAARDFTRFRRELFVQLTTQYYGLIRQFRQVEINSQNYFTFVRQFNQGEAEFQAGMTSRIQLDQVETQVISNRQTLLSTCTSLENSLDDLKLRIGLPTELPLNLDLTELNLLTLRDELAVNGELVARVRSRLLTEMRNERPARATLVSAGTVLLERMIDSIRLRERLGEEPPDATPLEELRLRMMIESTRLTAEEARSELDDELQDAIPSLPVVFQRRMDMLSELLRVIELQNELTTLLSDDDAIDVADDVSEWQQLQQQATQLGDQFQQLVEDENLDTVPQLVDESEGLQRLIESTVTRHSRALDLKFGELTPERGMELMIAQINQLLRDSEAYLGGDGGGLVPVEIDMDDAMMTALVRRFDLVNERGFLADDWRQIKLAADDLKSILNLRATQTIRTRNGFNRPFDFTFDDSTTALGATFDAPFNRRAQRNGYRQTLFNYQAALRRITQLEDNIKLAVRRDLRSLSLERRQYANDIAGAALTFERVVSTELELRLGMGGVAQRDFIESQNAYTRSLSAVANRHIAYILERMGLFLDLELLTVGDDGFWPQLYDEQHQPLPFYQLPPRPAYGCLHPCLKYSPEILQMLCVPNGIATIRKHDSATAPTVPAAEAETLPDTETTMPLQLPE